MARPVRNIWWPVVMCVGLVASAAFPCSAAQEPGEEMGAGAEPENKVELVLNEAQIERLQRRLDQLTEQQQKLREAMDEIKAELAIIKVRVTN